MQLKDAIDYFGNKYKLSKVCGFALCTPFVWATRGFIPYESQLKIEAVSKGALKADELHKGVSR